MINELRADNGLEPLAYPTEGEGNQPEGKVAPTEDHTKQVEEPKEKTEQAAKDKVEPTEPTSEDILKFLQKQGINVNSLEDLKPKKTEADLQLEKEQRENEKIAYGLQKGFITKKEHESFILDMNDPVKVVYNDFKKDLLDTDPELSESEIKEKFDERYGQDNDESSIQFKRGKKELEVIANKLIQEKHAKILGLEREYERYESSEKEKTEFEAKVRSAEPIYKRDISEITQSLKKIQIPIGEKQFFEFDVEDSVLTPLANKLLEDDRVRNSVSKGYDKDEVKGGLEAAVILKSLPSILTKYANAEVLKQQAGVRGVPPNRVNVGARPAFVKKAMPSNSNDELDVYEMLGVPNPRKN